MFCGYLDALTTTEKFYGVVSDFEACATDQLLGIRRLINPAVEPMFLAPLLLRVCRLHGTHNQMQVRDR